MDIESQLVPGEKIVAKSEITKKPFVVEIVELGICFLFLLGALILFFSLVIDEIHDMMRMTKDFGKFLELFLDKIMRNIGPTIVWGAAGLVFLSLFCAVTVIMIIDIYRMCVKRYDLVVTNSRVIGVHKEAILSMPYDTIVSIGERRKGNDKRYHCGRIRITTGGRTFEFPFIKSSEELVNTMMQYHKQYLEERAKMQRTVFIQTVPQPQPMPQPQSMPQPQPQPQPTSEQTAQHPLEQAPEPKTFLFCSKCGTKNDSEDVFCKACGAKLKK